MDTQIDKAELVQRVVTGCMKLMYDKRTFPMLMRGISAKAPIAQKLALETAGIMLAFDKQLDNGIPVDVAAASSILVLNDLALFLRQASNGQSPTREDVTKAMKILQQVMKTKFVKECRAVKMKLGQQQQMQQPQQAQQGLIQGV